MRLQKFFNNENFPIYGNEPDLIWKSSASFGAPLTLGAWGKLPLLPPLSAALELDIQKKSTSV